MSTYPEVEVRVFTPPVSPGSRLFGQHRLWKFIHRADEGLTVYKTQAGPYVEASYPTSEALAAASVVYLGGHATPVSAAEETSLTAAGYGAYITTVADPIVNVPMSYPERALPIGSPNPPATHP